MKISILVISLLAISMTVNAQAFKKGTKYAELSLGLGSRFWTGVNSSLPLNPRIGAELGITDEISFGGSLSYSGAKASFSNYYGDKYSIKYKAYFIAARGAYHFRRMEKLDPYLGASLGYIVVSASDNQASRASGSGIGYGAYAGTRYYFQPKLAINAELSYSSFSFLTFGITRKL